MLAEQRAGEIRPDVLTLQTTSEPDRSRAERPRPHRRAGGVVPADAPPAVTISDTVPEAMLVAARARRLVIRHLTGDRIVALVEIVSPGNKEKPGVDAVDRRQADRLHS